MRKLFLLAMVLVASMAAMLPATVSAKNAPRPERIVTVDSCLAGELSFVEWNGVPTGSVVLEYTGPGLKVKSEVEMVSPTASDGSVAVWAPDAVGYGWVLTKARLYASSDGLGKSFAPKVGIPCDDGPPCPAAPVNLARAEATRVNNDPYWTWTADPGGWDNSDGHACGDITFTYEWWLAPDHAIIATGSPVDILKSLGSNCSIRVLVTATNRFGSTGTNGEDTAGCG